MKRLTINYPDGTIQGTGTLDDIILRLAAYEDTGLEPEEAEACKVALMGKTLAEIKEIEGLSIERMKELAKAEAEDRLLILPCKVGDTVYRYSHVEQRMQALKCEGFLQNGLYWKVRCTDLVPSWVGNQKRHFYIAVSSFGKTVFLTREEAEAALRGGAHG